MRFKVLKPIAFGGRQEVGTILNMTEDTANSIGKDYLIPVTKAEKEIVEEVEEKELDDMSVAELRDKAISLELAKSGTKADLIERITLALEEPVEEEVEE